MIRLRELAMVSILCASLTAAAEPATNLFPADKAAASVSLPPGFKATIFASEPDVHQPIAMAFDDRGRLWVAECNTYSNAKTNFDLSLNDRILIFEDSKGTGHFDKRTVFWEGGKRLSSIALGFGGVFATCAPNLLFIPDRNGDDVPDGPPEVLLDGWNADIVRHNIVNGLKWGPDGWLYGRQGILATSLVGPPGTAAAQRTKMDCGIWRYHPTRKKFEVFCQGTTNPWGHDWDEYGRLFFINTVIGHFWQGIPGAYYKRMYGEPLTPFHYGLIDQAADHYHWDINGTWQHSREAGSGADSLGGGHAHSGLMIYSGTQWPEKYRGQVFTLNFHGRRINEDLLAPLDSGPVAKHAPDMAKFGDPWFRGIDLDYGPDGSVYVLDWSDSGECHGTDNVDRESGRIYRIAYDSGKKHSVQKQFATLKQASATRLLEMQLQPNEWFARHARRRLQEESFSNKVIGERLKSDFKNATDSIYQLRLMFCLHAIAGDDSEWLSQQLKSVNPWVRGWAVCFLSESGMLAEKVSALLVNLARDEPQATVRLELASALQRLPVADREPLAMTLVVHGEDNSDRYLPLMLWYGIEPFAANFPLRALELAKAARISLVRQFIPRRVGEMFDADPSLLQAVLKSFDGQEPAAYADGMQGLIEALRTGSDQKAPPSWPALRDKIQASGDRRGLKLAQELGALLGDDWARSSLLADAKAAAALPPDERKAALKKWVDSRPADLNDGLKVFLDDPVLCGTAAAALILRTDDAAMPQKVLNRWSRFGDEDRKSIVALMVTRAGFARALLEAIAQKKIERSALNLFQARQVLRLGDDALSQKLFSTWGQVRPTGDDKRPIVTRYRSLLTPARLKTADVAAGHVVFQTTCAVCHKLLGEGNPIGPDLTGSGRSSLDYLLENIVDPSAVVPPGYQLCNITLDDDRVLSGVIAEQNDTTVTLQTLTEKLLVERKHIAKLEHSKLSMMPEGLLESLKNDQACNLIAYLMGAGVPGKALEDKRSP
jgi:putative membrane-bound dehydrogenase-like protein